LARHRFPASVKSKSRSWTFKKVLFDPRTALFFYTFPFCFTFLLADCDIFKAAPAVHGDPFHACTTRPAPPRRRRDTHAAPEVRDPAHRHTGCCHMPTQTMSRLSTTPLSSACTDWRVTNGEGSTILSPLSAKWMRGSCAEGGSRSVRNHVSSRHAEAACNRF